MKLQGFTEAEVDDFVAKFTTLMKQEMQQACSVVANDIDADGAITADGYLYTAIDSLGVFFTQWKQTVTTTLMPFLEKLAVDAGKKVVFPLGDVSSIKTVQALDTTQNMIMSFSNDMWDSAKASLSLGVQDGESIAQLAMRIENVANVKAKKAHVIAQTAVIAAVNGGEWQQMLEAAKVFDTVTYKEWVSTHDSHTRPTHHAADGQRQELNAHFVVGGAFLQYPGDPDGPPEEIISCRCTTTYDMDVDEPITASQTSLETLSTDSVATVLGPDSALVAAFNEKDHPRGKDGKFIKSNVVGGFVKFILSGKFKPDELLHSESKTFTADVSNLKAEDWHNFTDEQQKRIHDALEHFVNTGVPGSAKATAHVEDLSLVETGSVVDDINVFNPDIPLIAPPDKVWDVEKKIFAAHDDGVISDKQHSMLLNILNYSGPDAASSYLHELKTENDINNVDLSLASPSMPAVPTLTTGSSTPVKITHGLIHAKHTPGTVIAQSDVGLKITWNGSSYDISNASGSGEKDVKKSKLYALLNSKYKLAEWKSPGKQETEVSHATSLDAAPPTNPIPHPVSPPSVIPWTPIPDLSAPTPNDTFGDSGDVKTEITAKYFAHEITQKQFNELLNGVNNGTLSPSDAKTKLDSYVSPVLLTVTPPTPQSPSTPNVAKTVDLTGWKKVGGQSGSNLGGLYESLSGEKFYIKSLKSEAHAKNEVLAAALYNAAGINVPEVRHGDNHPSGWKNVVISPIVPNAKTAKSKLTTSGSFGQEVHSGYAVDAWLANYDVVGLTHDNIVESNGKPWRIDVGGSLAYRAQGSKKTDWNDDPNIALSGLKDTSKNPQAASVFGGMTNAEEKESAKKLLGISDDKINQMVKDAGLSPSMADTLKNRKKAILAKYGLSDSSIDTVVPHPLGDVSTLSPSPVSIPAPTPTSMSQAFGDINELDTQQLSQLDVLWKQYEKGLLTTDELHKEINVVKNTPTTSTSAPSVTANDIDVAKKYQFYQHFKAEKVSPSWSGAKIYNSMHAAKMKMSGDSQIAALPDAEMLKILDKQHWLTKPGLQDDAYSSKVNEWLKTPAGKKAFQQLNSNVSTMAPSIAKKVAKKLVSAPDTATQTPSDVLGVPDTTGISDTDKSKLYTAFKAAGAGAYLKSSPHDIFYTATQTAKANPGTSPLQILKIADEEGAKKFGIPNTNLFEKKITEWAATSSGSKKIVETYNDALLSGTGVAAKKVAKKVSGGGTTGYVHLATTPLNDKIPPLNMSVEQFDPSKGYDWTNKYKGDFPVINDAKAKSMAAQWSASQGGMTATQRSALRKYTGSGFTEMNNYLRGYSGATAQTHNNVVAAQAGMRLSAEPIVLHRGNGWFKGWNSVAEVKSHLGEDFHQEAFFSASIGGKSGFGGPINFIIECPPGTPMAYVKTFSQHSSENEMLLGGNMSYKVVEVLESNKAPDGSQHYGTEVTVRLRVIPPTDAVNTADIGSTP